MKNGTLLSWTLKALGVLIMPAIVLTAGAAALAWHNDIDWRQLDPKDLTDLAAIVGAPILYLFLALFVQRLFLARNIDLHKATSSDPDVTQPLWAWSLRYLANMSLVVAWLFGTATEACLLKIPYTLADVVKFLLVAVFGIAVSYIGGLINRVFDRLPQKTKKPRR